MKKVIILSTIIAALSCGGYAEASTQSESSMSTSDQNELIGFGSGIATGAVFGGPLGAFAGGIFGLLVANDINDENTIQKQQVALQKARTELGERNETVSVLRQDLHELMQDQLVQTVNFEETQQRIVEQGITNLQSHIQFKTGSIEIDPIYHSSLDGLAILLTKLPDLAVSIEGYADQRGNNQFNQKLSTSRAEAVANYLKSQKVADEQLSILGKGEVTTTDLNKVSAEKLFFDRRVNIRVLPKGQVMTAAN